MIFNNLCLIAGFLMLGLPPADHVATRYAGAFIATGAYVCNWAAVNAYIANNVIGQWNRATIMGSLAMAQGLGGVAGSFIVKADEAPRYKTAVWVIVGYFPCPISSRSFSGFCSVFGDRKVWDRESANVCVVGYICS